MNRPIFIPPLFFKVLAVLFLVTVAGIMGVVAVAGSITTLDLAGTFISMIIVAYIVHLWIYYGRRHDREN